MQNLAITTVQKNQPTLNQEFQFDSEETRRNHLVRRFEDEAVPHFHNLKRLALHLTRNQTEAEDLTQETFAQALKSFDRYESGTNCRAWLCQIMFYKRLQWIRANSRFCQFDENETPPTSAVTRSAMLPPEYVGEKLSLALSALPEKSRQIVWLAAVEEFTYREIAERLNIPVGTVMSRLHRGRQTLRVNFSRCAEKSSAHTFRN